MSNGKQGLVSGLVISGIVVIGLVSFTIAGDSRTVNRCDRLESRIEKNAESNHELKIELTEIKGDIKTLIKIQEIENKERLKQAKDELNGNDSL